MSMKVKFSGIESMDEDELRNFAGYLLSENVKLRELMVELYEDQCDECDRWKYRDRMRKLGIEVPE